MTRPSTHSPAWLAGRTWYHVHALAALECEPTSPDAFAPVPLARRLPRLEAWLDHVARLGAGGLLLTPVFASLTHGYDTVDALRVDPRLGDEEDLRRLIDLCHRRDLRILLDGVFHHVSRAFPPFADVLRHRRASAYRGWFRLDFEREGPDGFSYQTFEGHHRLVALDHRSEQVLRWATDVALYWLGHGVDGWRLDAAYAVLPSFWVRLSDRVRARFPDALLIGEVIHGDYSKFVEASGLHGVTQYELYKAIWSALSDVNCFELSWALRRHTAFSRAFVPLTFVGNHDVTRILSRLRDPNHLGLALAVLFTVPGSPCIYYGDEVGARGVKEHREGGDDAIRPPLPDEAMLAGDDAQGVLALYHQLIALRRARPWLTEAQLAMASLAKSHCQYTASLGFRTLLVRLNPGAAPVEMDDLGRSWRAIAGCSSRRLPPSGWSILEAA